jgi:hypothetical protein
VRINGSALIEGIVEIVGKGVTITGGLAGDDGAFQRTFTLFDAHISSEEIVGVVLRFVAAPGHGCSVADAWATPKNYRARGNVLAELDGAPTRSIQALSGRIRA